MKSRLGVTLVELLCVITIIAILAAMLLPTLSRGYRRAKAMSEESEVAQVAERLRHQVRNFCARRPQYRFDTKDDFKDQCQLDPKCREWIDKSQTVFVPFSNLDSTDKLVVSFHYGRKYSRTEDFTKGELTVAQ